MSEGPIPSDRRGSLPCRRLDNRMCSEPVVFAKATPTDPLRCLAVPPALGKQRAALGRQHSRVLASRIAPASPALLRIAGLTAAESTGQPPCPGPGCRATSPCPTLVTQPPTWPPRLPRQRRQRRLKRRRLPRDRAAFAVAPGRGRASCGWRWRRTAPTPPLWPSSWRRRRGAGAGCGYAGLKDRYAITRQWFSIYLPRARRRIDAAAAPGVQGAGAEPACEEAAAGDLAGNQFRIVLREVTAAAMPSRPICRPSRRRACPTTLARSALALMAAMWSRAARCWRVRSGCGTRRRRAFTCQRCGPSSSTRCWRSALRRAVGRTLAGDVMDEAGRPTGPLWGQGRVSSTDEAQALENSVRPAMRRCATAWSTRAWTRSAARWWQARRSCAGSGRSPGSAGAELQPAAGHLRDLGAGGDPDHHTEPERHAEGEPAAPSEIGVRSE